MNEKFGRTGNIDVDINVKSRQQLALQIYKESGFSGRRLEGHLKGIDYTKDVDLFVLSRGRLVEQWQPPGNPVGNYFAPVGVDPFKLGMDVLGRERLFYSPVQRTTVLRSTAADMPSWKQPGYIYKGGETQYFTPIQNVFKLTPDGL